MLFRIAAQLAYGRTSFLWWRRVTVPLAGSVVAIAALLVLSLFNFIDAQAARTADRTPQIVAEPGEANLAAYGRWEDWEGEQYQVWWTQPLSASAPLPPGLDRYPAPGEFIVSSGLDRLARSNPQLAERLGNYSLLGSTGVRDGDELLAYAGVEEDREIGSSALLIRDFGGGNGNSELQLLPALLAGVLFLVFPAVLVAAAALSTATPERDYRMLVLRWLGTSRRQLRRLAAIEAALLLAPGAALAGALWLVLGGSLSALPLVGRHPNPGDLAVSPIEVIASALGTVLLAAAVAGWLSERAAVRAPAGPRPEPVSQLSLLRILPIAGGLALTFKAGLDPSSDSSPLVLLIGAVCMLVGLPLLLPIALRLCGRRIGGSSSVVLMLAGRRLEFDPRSATRALAGLTAFTFTALAAIGYLAVVRQPDPAIAEADRQPAAMVTWLDPQPGDLDRFQQALGGFPVGLYDPNSFALSLACEELAAVAGGRTLCADGQLTADGQTYVARALRVPPDMAPFLRLVPLSESDITTNLAYAVALNPGQAGFAEAVRLAAGEALFGPQVLDAVTLAQRESPLVDWILAGLMLSAALISVSLLISVVDRYLRSASDHSGLILLGVEQRRLWRLETYQFLIAFTLAISAALAAGCVAISVMTQLGVVAFPTMPVLGVIMATIVVALAGALVLGFAAPTYVRAAEVLRRD